MRLFYAGDVHGSERCFRKFLNAAAFYGADVLVMGGDITGKVMLPIVEESPGRFVARLFNRTEQISTEEELREVEKSARFNGFYPYRCDRNEYERLQQDEEYRSHVMSQTMASEVERWMSIADDKLKGTGVRCFVMPGNDDELDIDPVLASETVQNPDGRVVRFDEYQMLSSCWANPTPWDSPREMDEDSLAKLFDQIASDLEPDIPVIFNLHVPPYDSGLDIAAELDEDLSVVTSGGHPNMIPVGSRAVRDLIESVQPLLSLHGHIHESRNEVRIGKTLCLNPGSNYADGVLDGAIVDLKNGKVKRHQFVSG